jgi:Tfp pilus assembly protein FimV
MNVKTKLIYKVLVLSLLAHQSLGLAQPLELVALSDKGGLLPPEEKSSKDEALKNTAIKSLTSPKKPMLVASSADNLGATAPTKGNSRTSYVVKPGDTLEKVIAQQLSDSPMKPELLRKELMALNPIAFTKGNPKMLLAGATLKLPNSEQMVNKQSGNATWSADKANLALSGYTTYPPLYPNVQASEKRRHWVQYP